ncbi:MAG TPA: M56 family metallopeptidase [Nitrolancea sp.]|jgi:Zn-dependent protease with chaperone function|nr:M56 family metallopeptidase [Nitrolancea sp.]
MTRRLVTKTRLLLDYRATVIALTVVFGIAIWPSLLLPLAREYAEFNLRHPGASPLAPDYPPYVVAAILLWFGLTVLLTVGLMLRQLVGQYRLDRGAVTRRSARANSWDSVARETGIGRRLVVVADPEPFAFCAGFLFPSVYVSEGLLAILSPTEIEAVLRHEASHLRRRDPLRLFLIELLRSVFAPFPIIETLAERVCIGIELAADRAALAIVPMPTLASALVKVVRATSKASPLTVAGLTPSEARIDALLGKPIDMPYRRRDLIVTGVVALTVAGLLAHLSSLQLCPICPNL